MTPAKFSFPAVRGIQASMEYYVTMVPLDCISKLFTFSDENMPPEIRSQRTLNKARIPEMCDYILKNPMSYVFSALTASIDGEVCFEPAGDSSSALGNLSIAMTSKLVINDGQHRKAAIEAALKKNPNLKYEHISMVLYHDIGLKRSQQMFSDLNRFAVRPTQSLNILYDSRGKNSVLVKAVIDSIPGFDTLVDKEHTAVPNRSKALFTLSAFYRGTTALLEGLELSPEEKQRLASEFWKAVYDNMPEWQNVKEEKVKSSIVRKDSLSPLSITIRALGEVGNRFYKQNSQDWNSSLKRLGEIDWSRQNKVWSNGIVVNGSVQLSRATQKEMVNTLLKELMK